MYTVYDTMYIGISIRLEMMHHHVKIQTGNNCHYYYLILINHHEHVCKIFRSTDPIQNQLTDLKLKKL